MVLSDEWTASICPTNQVSLSSMKSSVLARTWLRVILARHCLQMRCAGCRSGPEAAWKPRTTLRCRALWGTASWSDVRRFSRGWCHPQCLRQLRLSAFGSYLATGSFAVSSVASKLRRGREADRDPPRLPHTDPHGPCATAVTARPRWICPPGQPLPGG